jgi:NADH-quinone oxidoreductase subunit J
MNIVFFVSAAVALAATILAVTRLNAVHALLYLILSLLAMALVFFSLGAAFVAALEVVIYAGAIVVLFIFVVMMLNLGPEAAEQERTWQEPRFWVGPAILAAVLLGELIVVAVQGGMSALAGAAVDPKQVSLALYGPYLVGVELASLLLLAGLVGAYHLGRRARGTTLLEQGFPGSAIHEVMPVQPGPLDAGPVAGEGQVSRGGELG